MIKEKMTRAWREINLNAVEHNIYEVRKRLLEHTMIMGVVKADAYGHGALEVSKAMLSAGVSMLAVAEINEAATLRQGGICAPILILGPENCLDISKVIELDITPAVCDEHFAEELSKCAKEAGKTVKIHIKLDTGMTRVGFNLTDESLKAIKRIYKLPGICIEGIFSHFACADAEDRSITDKQFSVFCDFIKKLESLGVNIPIKHIANSAAILRFPEYQLDMVRAGIISYGYFPAEKELFFDADLIPVMTLKAKVTRINNVKSGTSVSYGHTYTTNKNTKIATVSIGYADGYRRLLSNKAYMFTENKAVPVIGRICMDQCMIDVSSVNNINIGDEVIVFGDGINSTTTADTLAEYTGTISYEILCLLGTRLPHVFIKDGRIW